MSKQPPADLAAEQSEEIANWTVSIVDAHTTAILKADYATVAHLHKALAGVMRNYQKFRKEQESLRAEVIQHMIDEATKEDEHGVVETD